MNLKHLAVIALPFALLLAAVGDQMRGSNQITSFLLAFLLFSIFINYYVYIWTGYKPSKYWAIAGIAAVAFLATTSDSLSPLVYPACAVVGTVLAILDNVIAIILIFALDRHETRQKCFERSIDDLSARLHQNPVEPYLSAEIKIARLRHHQLIIAGDELNRDIVRCASTLTIKLFNLTVKRSRKRGALAETNS